MSPLRPSSSLALLALFAATACTTVPARERDGSTSDGGSSMDGMSSDDVTAQPEASSETGAITDAGSPADTSVAQDAGVIVDTGVLDSGVIVDSGACRPPSRLCAGRCADTATDTANCGTCGNVCTGGANAVAECVASACGLRCNTGFANCDSIASNGCEVNTNTSTAHCGRCNNSCPARANATVTCAAGVCGFTCLAGFGDCDGNAANGCETSLTRDPANCGRCGTNCGPNGACINGSTTPTCVSCANNTCGTYCATLATDTANCGTCGYRCPAAPAGFTAACAAGFCRYGAACAPAYGDCNRTAGDGYEVNLDSSSTNCGACGTTCAVGTRCCNGTCRSLMQPCFSCG